MRVAELRMQVAPPGEAVARLLPIDIPTCGRYHKGLITSADHLFDLELLESRHSLRKRILDDSAATGVKAVRADLSALLVGERRRHSRLSEVLLDGGDPVLVCWVAVAALLLTRSQVDHFSSDAPALTFLHYLTTAAS